MDTEDYSGTYLKFLNDGPHSYLLHNSEVGLGENFIAEPIFTEIEASDWPAEGFSVLLNGSLLAEECNAENQNVNSEKSNGMGCFSSAAEIENTNKNEMISNGFFSTNDVLLKFNSKASEESDDVNKTSDFEMIEGNILEENNAYTMTLMNDVEATEDNVLVAETAASPQETTGDCQMIQFLNLDGTVTTFNRNTLSPMQQPEQEPNDPAETSHMEPIKVNLDAFVTTVSANKCKVCSFLCEGMDGIIEHLKIKHADMFAANTGGRSEDEQSFLAPKNMMSILNNSNQSQKSTIFLCCICKNGYSDREELKQHMIESHKMESVCENENKNEPKTESKTEKTDIVKGKSKEVELRTKSSLLLKLQQRALKKVKCSIKGCDLRFARDDLRLRHEECHINGQKKQFMCTVCKEKFSIWRICSMHMWKCHKIDMGLLTCPICNQFKSNLAVRVLAHMMIHNEERPYLCGECGKRFKQLCQLQNHQAFHKATEDAPNWLNPKQCDICERFFSNSKSLKIHIKAVHDKFKPFMCSVCGHKASRKSMIELHMRQHTGEKPHQCELCTYKCRDISCLRKHVMTHVGSTKYQCPHCNYQSIQTSAYKNHLAKKHPGESGGTYACSECSYTTVNETYYYMHVKSHKLSAEKRKKTKASLAETGKPVENDKTSEENKTNPETDKSTYLIKVGDLTLQVEDDETQNSFNNYCPEEPVDIGGFTIPAGQEGQLQLVLQVDNDDMQTVQANNNQTMPSSDEPTVSVDQNVQSEMPPVT